MWRFRYRGLRFDQIKECSLCGKKSKTVSEVIGVCVECLRNRPEEGLRIALKAHGKSRGAFNLPLNVPRAEDGVKCNVCANRCRIPEGGKGFCGLVVNKGGRLYRMAGGWRAVVSWYYDPLPTNCVAWWFCPGCTGRGYPTFSFSRRGAEKGYVNLAVFYGACNSDCLFCQNWSYRENTALLKPIRTVAELVNAAKNERVSCVCFFGGDPGPQIMHALMASQKILEFSRREKRIIRICWETNGLIGKPFLKRMIELSLTSGGIIKFDLKAWTPSVYKALTGVSNRSVYENFKTVAKYIGERPEVPLLTASTLLVPGYVDEYEVSKITEFIASLDPEIPYSLLAFHPDYMLTDLPPTSRRHALTAYNIAKKNGLKNVHIGNEWILGDYY
ncbi:MAG: radical SAM protein [Thermoproteales archaeon]|nr:radical SAM protein [Thermoproteales archaeon]RLE64476.1 MAG: radical SAM protein [Thermoprotei archaeon]